MKPINSTYYNLRGCELYGTTEGRGVLVELRKGARVLGTFKLDPVSLAMGNWEMPDYQDMYEWAEKLAADEWAKELNGGKRGDQIS